MHYDPMTGQPIADEGDSAGSTANTGNAGYTGGTADAGYTGNPANTGYTGNASNTGSAANTGSTANTGSMGNFDPMTGQPLNSQAQPMNGQVQPGAQPPFVQAPVKKSHKKAIIITVAVCAAVAAAAFFLIPILFPGNINKKIRTALNNSFKADHLLQALDVNDTVKSGQFTVTGSGSVSGVNIDLTYMADKSKKKQALNGDVSAYGIDFGFSSMMDDHQIKIQMPDVTDKTMIYDYTAKKSGYLADFCSSKGINLDGFDKALSLMNSGDEQQDKLNDMVEKAKKVTDDRIDAMKFEKAGSKSCTVNGKDQNCTGYKAVVTEKDIKSWIDDYKDVYGDYMTYMEDVMKTMGAQSSSGFASTDSFEQLKDSIDNMPDTDVTVYLYKSQVALLDIRNDEGSFSFAFEGGDVPMQNMKISMDVDGKESSFEKTASVKDSMETISYVIDGDKSMKLDIDYDYKKGDLKVKGTDVSLEGNLLHTDGGFDLSIDKISTQDTGSISPDVKISLKKGASIEDLKGTGDTFDMGSATESDWDEIGKDFMQFVMKNYK